MVVLRAVGEAELSVDVLMCFCSRKRFAGMECKLRISSEGAGLFSVADL